MKGKRVMNTVTKVAAASVIAVCAQGLCAAEITWGGSSGRWHTKSNWIGGVVPAAEDSVIFPAGADYTVEITDNNTAAVSKIRLLPGPGRVTFLGDKKIAIRSGDGYVFSVGENREAVIDGSKVILDATGGTAGVEVEPNATLDVNGRLCLEYGDILVNTNATLNVRGGQIEYENDGKSLILAKNSTVNFMGGSNIIARIVNKISANGDAVISEFDGEGSKVIFSGGYTKFPNAYSFSSFVDYSKTQFSFLGGTVNMSHRLYGCSKTLFPSKGALLVNRCSDLAMQDQTAKNVPSQNDIWELGGKAIFTKASSYAYVGSSSGTRVLGGGELSIGSLHLGRNNDCEMDLARIDIVSNFYSLAEHEAHSGKLYFRDGITFGSLGDVSVIPRFVGSTSRFVPCGKLKFDTVVDDSDEPKSFDLFSRFKLSEVTSLEVEDGGTVSIDPEDKIGYLRCLAVDDGATVILTNSNSGIVTLDFVLGAGSTLAVGTNQVDVASSVTLGDGAKIRYSFSNLQTGAMYPLWVGPHGTIPPVLNFEFYPALPEGWTVATSGSTAYLWDGTICGIDEDEKSYWVGSVGGNWNDKDNWTTNGVPGNSVSFGVMLSGNRQLAVTNDYTHDVCFFRNLIATASAGPYIVSGKPLSPFYSVSWGNSSSVANNSAFPLTVESKMYKNWRANKDDTIQSFFYVQGNSNAGVVLAGGGVLTNAVLRYRGDLRIGGDWVTLGLNPVSGGGRDTRLVLNPGAYLETTEQGSNQTATASYQISAGAGMTINGSVWRWTTKENTHFVDGVVTSTCPVQATARQTFIGDGVLSLAMVQSDSEGPGDLKFAEDITVRPAGWKTVRAGADNPMTMVARGNATIGAWGDWVYGAEEGFESSTAAADRALKVVGGAKTYVSFDTEGNTITLNDPLVVEKWSTVLKKGEGALVLKSDENDLGDSEIELIGGELRLSEPQAFGKLTFAGGKIAIDDGFNADTYTPIFTAKKIIGEVEVAGRFGVKTVAGDNGITVSVRRKRGAAVILR